MNALKRTLIEKAGHDFGFEYTVSESLESLTLGSARHPLQVEIELVNEGYRLLFANAKQQLLKELKRDFPIQNNEVLINSVHKMANIFKRAAALAHSLPNQAEGDFELALEAELKKLPGSIKNTEVERIVRQRVGQDIYRKAMLEYWGGACAVTGISIPEVLRASHAKPWSDCSSDVERLDVFNGFLFTANFDALFDRFLISFNDEGKILVSKSLLADKERLNLSESMKLRWLSDAHKPYLAYHRENFYQKLPS